MCVYVCIYVCVCSLCVSMRQIQALVFTFLITWFTHSVWLPRQQVVEWIESPRDWCVCLSLCVCEREVELSLCILYPLSPLSLLLQIDPALKQHDQRVQPGITMLTVGLTVCVCLYVWVFQCGQEMSSKVTPQRKMNCLHQQLHKGM